jgi:hypothetical protein
MKRRAFGAGLRPCRSPDRRSEIRAEWLSLAERRMADVKAGKVVGIPADQVLKNLLVPPP